MASASELGTEPEATVVAVSGGGERPGRARRRDGRVGPAVDTRPTRHCRGESDAPVVIVEFGDFECPYCARAAGILHELVAASDGLVRQVFRHFPVFEHHPYALTAALAAEVAGAHGKFWDMHDLLFAGQDKLADEDLMAYAETLGIDRDLVIGDAAQPYGDAVETDYASASELGVRGTPSIFVNGEPYRGRLELGPLRAAAARAAGSPDGRPGRRSRRAPWARR